MLAGTDLGTGGLGHVGAPPKTATGVAKEEGSLMAGMERGNLSGGGQRTGSVGCVQMHGRLPWR